MLKPVNLAPNYPDFWRTEFFYPAVSGGGDIALIGIGDIINYALYDWESVDYKGFDCFYLHQHCKGKYCIFDINEEAINLAASLNMNVERRDLCESPLPKKFDWIFAADVIEHTESPLKFLQNISSSLNKNGIACLTTPNPDFWRNAIPWRLKEEPTHLCAISRRHFEIIAHKLSLEIISLKDFQSTSPFMQNYLPLQYYLHKIMGKVFTYNSLVFCFKKMKK